MWVLCIFPFFFRPPTGEEKTYFLFCPLPLEPCLSSQVTIEISWASVLWGRGDKSKRAEWVPFCQVFLPAPSNPSTQLTKGVAIELKSHATHSFVCKGKKLFFFLRSDISKRTPSPGSFVRTLSQKNSKRKMVFTVLTKSTLYVVWNVKATPLIAWRRYRYVQH